MREGCLRQGLEAWSLELESHESHDDVKMSYI
jgi:hypothetical protein